MAKKRMESTEEGGNINDSTGKAGASMEENLAQMKKNAAPENDDDSVLSGGEEEEQMLENGDLNGIIFTSEGLEYESTTD
jgi:hypothetical protein